jgi:hypothetical protein
MERTNAAAVLLRGTARNFLERVFTIMAITGAHEKTRG